MEEKLEGLQMRQLHSSEVDCASKFWCEDLGFDIGVRLFQRWYRFDPEAFRCIVDGDGQIVATASAVKQTDDLFFVGTVGVDERYRGRGLSRLLLQNLRYRNLEANFALSAVPEYLPLYERIGFQKVDEPFAYIFKGKLTGEPKVIETPDGFEIEEFYNGHQRFNELEAYDADVHGYVRNIKLTLLDDEDGIVFATSQAGKINGFGKVQTNQKDGGAWFGPIYADNETVGRFIFHRLLKHFQRQAQTSVYVILTEQAMYWAEEMGLSLIEKSPRCYLSPEPEVLPKMQFWKLYAFDALDFSLL